MTFADVLEIKNGRNQRAVEDPNGVYPIYGSGGIMGYANDYICEAETVIIGRKGNINKPIFVDEPFWNVDTAFGLAAKKGLLLPKYLYYFCLRYDFEKHNKTVTIPSLTKADLLNIRIELPSIEVQQRTIDTLQKIERVLDLRQHQLTALEDLIKARFVEMFSDEKRVLPMRDICSVITDGTHQPPKFVPEGIPFIFVSNITGNTLTYDAEKFIDQATYDELIKRTPIEIGDILLSTVGSYGHPAVVKSDKRFLFQRHIAYLKPRREIVNSDYLHGAILSPNAQMQIEEGVRGIAQKTLNLSEIKKMTIPVPEITRQQQFAAFVAQIDKSKSVIQKSLDETQLLFDSLMQKYFG